MSLELRIRPEAERDLEDAAEWYEKQLPGLGQDFLAEIYQCMKRIVEQPELYPLLHRNTRRALAQRFPFGVFYRLEGGLIIVFAVMHGSRDPQLWKHRT